MSLQWRLFAAFGGLIALVLLAQWLLIRDARQQISLEFGKAALALSEEITQGLEKLGLNESVSDLKQIDSPATGRITGVDEYVVERHVFHSEEEYNAFKQNRLKDLGDRKILKESTAASEISLEVRGPHEGDRLSGEDQTTRKMKFRLDHPDHATSLVMEIRNESQRIHLPDEGLSSALSDLSQQQMYGSLIVLALGLLAAAWLAHREAKPLRALGHAAHRLGAGELGTQIPQLGGGAEMRQTTQAFNHMSHRLEVLAREAEHNRESQNLAELSDIARGLAHTLRNPLNTLGLSLEELAALPEDQALAEPLVAQSRDQIRRIDHWIRSFLALASEGRGEVERIDLGGLLQDIALEAIQQDRRGIRIQLKPLGEVARLPGVSPELRAVIQALVVNAVEASENQGEVAIALTQEHDRLKITIQDHGSGIPEAVKQKLFTPHVTTKTFGSGMGLFLAHRIATNRYNGTLRLEDGEPLGTLATLILPLRNSYAETSNPAR